MNLVPVVAALLVAGPQLPPDENADPVSLTLHGAASLGAYEAGFDWAVLQLLRVDRASLRSRRGWPLRLDAITGSSAGAINALLTAALWCEADDSTRNASVDANLLRDTWMPLGFDALLPGNGRHYVASDGLFASAAFAPLVKEVREQLFSQGHGLRFRPGCRVPLGFTVTRVVPDVSVVSRLSIPHQHATVPMVLEVDARGTLRLHRQPISPVSGTVSEALALPEEADASGRWLLPPDEVVQALLASAAFPIAFGAQALCECRRACGPGQKEVTSSECPGPLPGQTFAGLGCQGYAVQRAGPELRLCRSNFIDGGFLDNAPVGLAIEQAEAFSAPRMGHALSAFLLDATTRRPATQPFQSPERSAQGITDAIAFAQDMVTTVRLRRLAETFSARSWNLTSFGLLRRSAIAVLDHGALLSALLGNPEPKEAPAIPSPTRGVVRAAQGRLLLRCLAGGAATLDPCATAVRDPKSAPISGAPSSPLTAEEVLRMATALASWMEGPIMLDPRASTVASTGLVFLAEEVRRFPHLAVDEGMIREMRAQSLRSVLAVRELSDRLNRRAGADARVPFQVLGGVADPELGAAARTALSELLGSPGFPGAAIAAVLARAPPQESGGPIAEQRALAALRRLDRLRSRAEELAAIGGDLADSATAIQSDTHGQRLLYVSTRYSPLAGDKLEHFSDFMDRPLRELDYYIGVYEALQYTAYRLCSLADPYSELRPTPVWTADGSGELDPSRPETQRCLGVEMGNSFRILGLAASAKADAVVRTLARDELVAMLGDSATAKQVAAGPEWSWLGPRPPDLPSLGAMGIALRVLLEPRVRCSEGAKEALCPVDLAFEPFLERLSAAGYPPESDGMRSALEDRGRWLAETVRRALDRAGTVEIAQGQADAPTTRKAVSMTIGAGETVSRAAVRQREVAFQLDPSTVPARPLANGSYLPIVLVHLIPYRVALDVVGGGIALSWLEPRVQLGPWFSVESTLQLIDLRFNPSQGFTTLGARGEVHLGPVALAAGPRWSLGWNGAGSHFGAEFGLLVLQDRLGVSFGFREIGSDGWKTPFVALTVADLNGMVYWLFPPAWRSGR